MGVLAPALLPLGFAGALLLAEIAPGDTVPVRIRYDAPSSCPDEQAFYGAVQSRTALVRPAREGETARAFRVHIALDPAGSVGELRAIEEGRDTTSRRVEAPTCDEVVQALALTVALSVDPMASIAPTRPPPAPPASTSAPPPPPPRASAVPAMNRPAVVPVHPGVTVEIGALGMVAHQLEPFVQAGGAVSAGIGWSRPGAWAPWLELTVGQLRNDIGSRPRDATLALTFASLAACPLRLVLTDAIDARMCARGEGGSLSARGRDVAAPLATTRGWWAAGVAGQGRWALSTKFVLKLDAGIAFPIVPRRFVIDNPPRTASETSWWAPFAGLGLAFRP
jgi:hypothetical protein